MGVATQVAAVLGHVWDLETGEKINALTSPSRGESPAIAFVPNSELLLITTIQGTYELLDYHSGERLSLFDKPQDTWQRTIAAHSNGTTILTPGGRCELQKWQLDGPELIASTILAERPNLINDIAWHPRQLSAAIGMTNRIVVLDTQTMEAELTLIAAMDDVRDVLWRVDGRHLLSASEDRSIRIWDVSSLH